MASPQRTGVSFHLTRRIAVVHGSCRTLRLGSLVWIIFMGARASAVHPFSASHYSRMGAENAITLNANHLWQKRGSSETFAVPPPGSRRTSAAQNHPNPGHFPLERCQQLFTLSFPEMRLAISSFESPIFSKFGVSRRPSLR